MLKHIFFYIEFSQQINERKVFFPPFFQTRKLKSSWKNRKDFQEENKVNTEFPKISVYVLGVMWSSE